MKSKQGFYQRQSLLALLTNIAMTRKTRFGSIWQRISETLGVV
jgi:hypothetical protein